MASANSRFSLLSRLQLLQPTGLWHVHPAELTLTIVEGPALTPCLRHRWVRRSRLMLLENPNDLFFRKPLRSIVWSSLRG
jgi:hypothetical protein